MATLTLAQAKPLLVDADFIERVTLLSVKRAITIGQAAVSAHPDVDVKHAGFACAIINDRMSGFVTAMVRAVALAVDTDTPATPLDAEITTAIASVWGTFAGVTPADKV